MRFFYTLILVLFVLCTSVLADTNFLDRNVLFLFTNTPNQTKDVKTDQVFFMDFVDVMDNNPEDVGVRVIGDMWHQILSGYTYNVNDNSPTHFLGSTKLSDVGNAAFISASLDQFNKASVAFGGADLNNDNIDRLNFRGGKVLGDLDYDTLECVKENAGTDCGQITNFDDLQFKTLLNYSQKTAPNLVSDSNLVPDLVPIADETLVSNSIAVSEPSVMSMLLMFFGIMSIVVIRKKYIGMVGL